MMVVQVPIVQVRGHMMVVLVHTVQLQVQVHTEQVRGHMVVVQVHTVQVQVQVHTERVQVQVTWDRFIRSRYRFRCVGTGSQDTGTGPGSVGMTYTFRHSLW